ncbi:hypothetical protein F511_14227 [Dorcoceras hygrometricum]|uniref:BAH domain-containing protein n=1 Tax=Dorcoceras hygrometricum TaxID=472368 RepID=A0A2Z7BP25_9LAMI|nr:hypothetical protein F511_14227 [Dorcoceras hygrometricum]
MFYVVSEEFLSVHGAENSVHAGFRWRSRREVVNWLTSMLSKQHWQEDYAMSPKYDPTSDVTVQLNQMPSHNGHIRRNLKGHQLDIKWLGSAWTCGKQLKHYSAFKRNETSIAVQSFVLVMAEKESRYIAYVEDMYEDRKCQKKVKVRWFHHNKEVRGVVSLRNPHPKEVFITPYIQVISAECIDGPAVVLSREHYEKCLGVFPGDMLRRMHFCFRQFKSNRVKPFKLSNLRGYFDQSIFSCFSPDFFEEEYSSEDDVKVGAKRNRSCRENQKTAYDLSYQKLKYDVLSKEQSFLKHVEDQLPCSPVFRLNEKIEFLCQDSGIRGCWFRCSVLEFSKKQIKILYDDVKDEDSCSNLEEWIPANRVAKADGLGMRHPGRPTVRPFCICNKSCQTFEVGDPVDAWWSDGWWEGVISNASNSINRQYQVYLPGENLYLDIELKNLRVSRDWVDGRWVDIKPNPNIIEIISAANVDTKFSNSSAVCKERKSHNSPTSCQKLVTHRVSAVFGEIPDLSGMTLTNVPLKDGYANDEQQQVLEFAEDKENCAGHTHELDEDIVDYGLTDAQMTCEQENSLADKCDNVEDGNKDDNLVVIKPGEQKCEAETEKIMTPPTST